MKPLNYSILRYFTTVDEACSSDVMNALKSQYSHFKAFNNKDILSAIMTAAANGLLEESRFDLDESNNLRVYYKANAEGSDMINRYIKD